MATFNSSTTPDARATFFASLAAPKPEDEAIQHMREALHQATRLPSSARWIADWVFPDPSQPFQSGFTLPPESFQNALAIRLVHETPGLRLDAPDVQAAIRFATSAYGELPFRPGHFMRRDGYVLLVPVACMDGVTVGYSFSRPGLTVRNAAGRTSIGKPRPLETAGPNEPYFPNFVGRFAFDVSNHDLLVVTHELCGQMSALMSISATGKNKRRRHFIAIPRRHYTFTDLPTRALFMLSNVETRLPSSSTFQFTQKETRPDYPAEHTSPPDTDGAILSDNAPWFGDMGDLGFDMLGESNGNPLDDLLHDFDARSADVTASTRATGMPTPPTAPEPTSDALEDLLLKFGDATKASHRRPQPLPESSHATGATCSAESSAPVRSHNGDNWAGFGIDPVNIPPASPGPTIPLPNGNQPLPSPLAQLIQQNLQGLSSAPPDNTAPTAPGNGGQLPPGIAQMMQHGLRRMAHSSGAGAGAAPNGDMHLPAHMAQLVQQGLQVFAGGRMAAAWSGNGGLPPGMAQLMQHRLQRLSGASQSSLAGDSIVDGSLDSMMRGSGAGSGADAGSSREGHGVSQVVEQGRVRWQGAESCAGASHTPWVVGSDGMGSDGVRASWGGKRGSCSSSGAFDMRTLTDSLAVLERAMKGSFYGEQARRNFLDPVSGEVKARFMGKMRATLDGTDPMVRHMLQETAMQGYYASVLPVPDEGRLLCAPTGLWVRGGAVERGLVAKRARVGGEGGVVDEEEAREMKRRIRKEKNRLSAARSNEKRREKLVAQRTELVMLKGRLQALRERQGAVAAENKRLRGSVSAVLGRQGVKG